jgi:hypothetical protein
MHASRQKFVHGHFERHVGPHEDVIHMQIAGTRSNRLEETFEFPLVRLFKGSGFCQLFSQILQTLEQSWIDEREILFDRVNDLKQDDIMSSVPKVFESHQQCGRVIEEIA